MRFKVEVHPPGGLSFELERRPSDLSCFARWARHQPDPAGMQESRAMKIVAACKDCGTGFVKYAYDGTVRCEVCRKARRRAAQEGAQ